MLHRTRTLIVVAFILILALTLFFSSYIGLGLKQGWIKLSYYTRPVWDSNRPPTFNITRHFYAENISDKVLCEAHNWTLREGNNKPKVFDAFLFSIELDLLEIRVRELFDVVDYFVLLESDRTFTGKPKPLHFQENKERFAFAQDRIIHGSLHLPEPTDLVNDNFELEIKTRIAMNDLLLTAGIKNGDVVIFSDVDEIPYEHTVRLLKSCQGIPSPIHLQMQNYLYSFEFPLVDDYATRPSAQIYDQRITRYRHSKISDFILADSGWHCSFCFPKISDFQFKMTGYSHSDRVLHESYLKPERIQERVCRGHDVFDYPPEMYRLSEIVTKTSDPESATSLLYIPKHILENKERFKYLLPGNCVRKE